MATQRPDLFYKGSVQTVGAVSASVFEFDVSTSVPELGVALDDCVLQVIAEIQGYASAGTVGATATIMASLRCKVVVGVLSSGTVAFPVALDADAALALAILTLDTSGTLIRARVTGVVGETVEWSVKMRVIGYQPT